MSTDPLFVDKVYDIVGLYLNPPESAVVLCVDEKSQVQALSRSQPAFPMMPGMPEKRTHDYVRNGTTSLFAAFNIADGTVISSLHRRHRSIEFKKFLAKIDAEVPADLDVHLICDNLANCKTPVIQAWLARHPRFCLHFTPAGSMLETGAHALGCTVFPAGTGQTEQQVQAMADLRPDGYVGTPSFLRIILEKADELGIALPSLRKALVSGEAFLPSVREALVVRGIAGYQVYATGDLGTFMPATRSAAELRMCTTMI